MLGGWALEGAADPQGQWLTEAHTIVKLQNLSDLTLTPKAKENLGNTNALPFVFIIHSRHTNPQGYNLCIMNSSHNLS